MAIPDKTQIFAAPPLIVRVKKGEAKKSTDRFVFNFRLGRGEESDIQLSDPRVSSNHAEIFWEDGQWWVKDLESKNGTYLNGSRITRSPLPQRSTLELALNGPALELEIEQPRARGGSPDKSQPAGITQIAERYFSEDDTHPAGEHTMLIRRAFHTVRKKQSKRYRTIIGAVLAGLAVALGALYFQTQRVKKLEELHATAENVFYTARTLELQLTKLQAAAGLSTDPQVQEMRRQQRQMDANYDAFMDELGISKDKLSQEEWLIYKVARVFGECTVSMPKGFVETVKQYIRYWRASPRMANGISRATSNGYPARIREVMLANGMPPQFFYLALQESGFRNEICGPETYAGIAKGMWQFIPKTAYKYGLRTGPLIDLPQADPLDERQDFEKSTAAAARYLRDLYQGEAQASGLLVMACYNWKETRIREMLNQMQENPRERNFWKLLNNHVIPQETYDYVFYIVSATVIGENPRLFGFDFDNPLE